MSVFWLFVIAGALLFLQGRLFRHLAAKSVDYARSFSKPAAFTGSTIEMVEVLSNRSRLPIPWLRVQSRIPAALIFGAGSMQEISGKMYHRSFFYLSPRSRVTRRHTVTLSKRGLYRVSSVSLTGGDLFGFGNCEKAIDINALVYSYPKLISDRELPLPCSRFMGDMLVRRFIMPDPYMVSGARAYRAGDSPREINWALNAKTGELQVKTHDCSADPKMLVVLNVQLSEHQWDALDEKQLESIEMGVSIAASICLTAIDKGAEAGFCANTTLETDETPAFIAPARSEEQKRLILETLARLTLRMRLNFYAYLEAIEIPNGTTDMLVLSCVDSEKIETEIQKIRSRGINVMLHELKGGKNDA